MVQVEVQAAILAQRKPGVMAIDVELPDGQMERVVLGSGRYRARDAAMSAEALGAVAVRLVGKDGAVLRAMRLAPAAPAPLPTAPAAAPAAVETEAERAMRLVAAIYDRAYKQAAEASSAAAQETREERELAWRGVGRAIEVMGAAVDRAAAQLAELSERERDASAREVEAMGREAEAAAASQTTAGAVATVLRELPAAAPALAQLAPLLK